MVTIVNNTVLYNRNLLRIECKCSNQNIYIYQITSKYTLNTLQFYQLYLNKTGKKNKCIKSIIRL